jgi:hypothetical protein
MGRSGPSVVTFYRMVDTAPEPGRAARGVLDARGGRHDVAATTAASFGWHVFPPCDFRLFWDGSQAFWTCAGLEDWQLLDAAPFPRFGERFDAAAPAVHRPPAPPFLAATRTPGVVRIWTGLAVRSAPGWSLLVRSPANLPRHPGFDIREGVVEADNWFGPLCVLIRLTRTDQAVRFRCDQPFVQVQPIPREAYADRVLDAAGLVHSLDAWGEADWRAYRAGHPQDQPQLAAAAD